MSVQSNTKIKWSNNRKRQQEITDSATFILAMIAGVLGIITALGGIDPEVLLNIVIAISIAMASILAIFHIFVQIAFKFVPAMKSCK